MSLLYKFYILGNQLNKCGLCDDSIHIISDYIGNELALSYLQEFEYIIAQTAVSIEEINALLDRYGYHDSN